MSRMLYVEDHPIYRLGFVAALSATMPELRIDIVANAEAGLGLLRGGRDYDLCLADLALPGMDGLAFLDAAGRLRPTMARALLCADCTATLALRAQERGLVACLSKARDMDGLADALSGLFGGHMVFDGGAPEAVLTERRRRVLALAAAGATNKEIGRELGISERTVKDHWARIFSVLGAVNRAEAVAQAHRLRLI